MFNNSNNNLDTFLWGSFTSFINSFRKETISYKNYLPKLCYLDALFQLNRFDEYYDTITNTELFDQEEKKLLVLNFKLFTFDLIPSYYYLKFHKPKDYYTGFRELLDEFDVIKKDILNMIDIDISKSNKEDTLKFSDKSLFYWYIVSDICGNFLSIASTFFKNQKISFTEYTDNKLLIFKIANKIVEKLEFGEKYHNSDVSDGERIYKALIFYLIGYIYTFEDNLKQKEKLCYEKSLLYKPNIFALTDLIDLLYDEKDEDAFNYFHAYENYDLIKQTEYYHYFSVISLLFKHKNNEVSKEFYYKTIKIIENMVLKTFVESYPYYNIALIEVEQKEFQNAEKHFVQALEILKKATNVDVEKQYKDCIYFFKDFEDYLYEICLTQISQKKDYSQTLNTLNSLLDYTYKNGYHTFKANLKYDLTILKSKINKSNTSSTSHMVDELESLLNQEVNYLNNKQIAEIRARLAYQYYELHNFDKYQRNIEEAITLDPTNKTALTLIALLSKSKDVPLFSPTHLKQIGIVFIIILFTTSVFLLLPLLLFTRSVFLLLPLLFTTSVFLLLPKLLFTCLKVNMNILNNQYLLMFLLTPIIIITLYPILHSLKVGSIELNFRELSEIPPKQSKFDNK